MEFSQENISTLEKSLDYLITSMTKTCQYVTKNNILENKPFWMNQTEKFYSFYNRIKDNVEAMENFRKKVVLPVYDTYNVSILNNLIENNIVQDDYLKVEAEDSNNFRIKATPGGIFFNLDKLFLPISEVYTQAVKYSLKNKQENIPYPVQILIGFYSSIYHAVKDNEDDESKEMIRKNIEVLVNSLEICDKPVAAQQGPMNMLQSMLGNIDLGQIGEMMGKVTGDPAASKEFGEVFGRMTEVIKAGGNPLDAMGEIIKNASIKASEDTVDNRQEVEDNSQNEEASVQE